MIGVYPLKTLSLGTRKVRMNKSIALRGIKIYNKGGETRMVKVTAGKDNTWAKCPNCGGGSFYYIRTGNFSRCMRCPAELRINWSERTIKLLNADLVKTKTMVKTVSKKGGKKK